VYSPIFPDAVNRGEQDLILKNSETFGSCFGIMLLYIPLHVCVLDTCAANKILSSAVIHRQGPAMATVNGVIPSRWQGAGGRTIAFYIWGSAKTIASRRQSNRALFCGSSDISWAWKFYRLDVRLLAALR
jgi:hypothetical protein